MAVAGGVVGPAFALEGYAFFVEAIFIGLYLYGWDRLSPKAHWLTGIPIVVSGALSALLVLAANAWMQTPGNFRVAGGRLVATDALAAFKAPAWLDMATHALLSSYIAASFAVAGVYAVGMLRGRRDAYHRSGLAIALAVGTVAAVLQPISGDITARRVARTQPAKLAAAEALFHTQRRAPLLIGGIPDVEAQRSRFGLEIPGGLSFLATHDLDAEVKGLDAFPPSQRPNVMVTHLAFDTMVGSAMAMLMVGVAYWLLRSRRRLRAGGEPRWLLAAAAAASPLGFLALEAGWFVTEVGRQPWVIYNYMPTADSVTRATEVPFTFTGFVLLYLFLGTVLVVLLRRLARSGHGAAGAGEEVSVVA
jgi:cytochrome d ubiquinol oxidase subunit I